MACTKLNKLANTDLYQSPMIGKEYNYIPKPLRISDKTSIQSVHLKRFETKTYFSEDHDAGFELSYSHSKRDGIYLISVNPYIYSGDFTVNHFKDEYESFNGSYNYYGGGLRSEFGIDFGFEHISIRPLIFQAILNFETGDYLNWRKEADKHIPNFKSVDSKKLSYSFYYAPEILLTLNKGLSIGVFGGIGNSFTFEESRAVTGLYGFNIRVHNLTFAFWRDVTEFDYDLREDSFFWNYAIVKKADYLQMSLSYTF
jgi:hypothetical protein